MWELAKTPSRGGNSVRSIFLFVLTAVIAALLLVVVAAPLTHADTQGATWNGDSIVYKGNQYIDNGVTTNKNGLDLPSGATYYSYVPTTDDQAHGKVDIIYFTTGQDPGSATSGNFVEYDLNMSSQPYTFSNAHSQTTVPIDTAHGGKDATTSCAIQGVGWIVCQVSSFLATGMDWIFKYILTDFLQVQPISTSSSNNDLYQAWNIMRSIANVAFIIVFLIIIYSQLTNTAISNYGLKKLLPRIIVGAVIVNLSYYMCVIVVDASNIIGVSLQALLNSLHTNLSHVSSSSTAGQTTWTNITSFVLSGGTAAGVGIAGTVTAFTITGGSATSAIFLLLPALVGLILAALIAFLILAARQAIIIIFIIISPLAFVAYLLPNTEQWFKKWRQTFMTMMIFFPAMSLVFGGAQLAGGLIVENATSLTTMILGMIVQVIPLAITPLLLRFSGSLIQNVAKQVQGFNKRLTAATSGWSKPRAESFKKRALGADLNTGNFARRFGRWNNYRQEAMKQRGEAGEPGFQEYTMRRTGSLRTGQGRMAQKARNERALEATQGLRDKALADMQAGNMEGMQQMRAMRRTGGIFSSAGSLDDYLDENGTLRDRFVTKGTGINTSRFVSRSMASVIKSANRTGIAKQAATNARHVYEEQFGEQIKASEAMQQQAGGINTKHDAGASIALADAINTIDKAGADNLSAANTVVSSYQLDDDNMASLAINGVGHNGKGEEIRGELFQQSAFNTMAKIGVAPVITAGLRQTAGMSEELRGGIRGALDGNHSSIKAVAFWAVDGKIKDDVVQGRAITDDRIFQVIDEQFTGGKVPRTLLASQDASTLTLIAKAIRENRISAEGIADIKRTVHELLDDKDTLGTMKPNARTQIAIINAL
jgi:hypothetical protein